VHGGKLDFISAFAQQMRHLRELPVGHHEYKAEVAAAAGIGAMRRWVSRPSSFTYTRSLLPAAGVVAVPAPARTAGAHAGMSPRAMNDTFEYGNGNMVLATCAAV
jgi:hypothetical protein